MSNYTFVPTEEGYRVKVLTGELEGCIIQYGRVAFEEKNDQAKMNFDYRILEHNETSVRLSDKELEKQTGDILVDIIEKSLMTGSVVYANGTN
jgi:hypothetical protein